MRCDTEPVLEMMLRICSRFARDGAYAPFPWRMKHPQGRSAAVTVGQKDLVSYQTQIELRTSAKIIVDLINIPQFLI